jgi:vacuolar-type H+-ATPase subunit H
MAEPTPTNGLSPLDQIRLVEAEITRRMIAAREASERSTAEARAQAALIKKQAREAGERHGQIRYKEIIARAEEQAKMILAQAHQEADHLSQKGQSRMERAIQEALAVVLGMDGGGHHDES